MGEKHNFKLPQDFDELSWEIEAKGFFLYEYLSIDKAKHVVSFYDVTRFEQELHDEIDASGIFYESNVVILRSLTKENIIFSLEKLLNRNIIRPPVVDNIDN